MWSYKMVIQKLNSYIQSLCSIILMASIDFRQNENLEDCSGVTFTTGDVFGQNEGFENQSFQKGSALVQSFSLPRYTLAIPAD